MVSFTGVKQCEMEHSKDNIDLSTQHPDDIIFANMHNKENIHELDWKLPLDDLCEQPDMKDSINFDLEQLSQEFDISSTFLDDVFDFKCALQTNMNGNCLDTFHQQLTNESVEEGKDANDSIGHIEEQEVKKYNLRDRRHTPSVSSSLDGKSHVEQTKRGTDASKTVIINQKDGTCKILELVPVSSDGKKQDSHVSCMSASHSKSLKSHYPRSEQGLMYPDTTGMFEDKSRKNAIQAKVNREKKKAYIASLEKQVSELRNDNNQLQSRTDKLQRERDLLAEEVTYLQNVLANQSMLSKLLGGITAVNSIKLTTSFQKTKEAFTEDHDYGQPAKRQRLLSEMSGGVCLHVENENVSLEFCSSCAKMARGAFRSEGPLHG